MWYMDGHILKNLYLKGLHLITFLDDASRCVPEQTCSEKPHQRIRVSSDRPLKGLEHLSLYSQATGLVLWTCTKGSKKMKTAAFKEDLLSACTDLINSGSNQLRSRKIS